jgi:hypothetical protein
MHWRESARSPGAPTRRLARRPFLPRARGRGTPTRPMVFELSLPERVDVARRRAATGAPTAVFCRPGLRAARLGHRPYARGATTRSSTRCALRRQAMAAYPSGPTGGWLRPTPDRHLGAKSFRLVADGAGGGRDRARRGPVERPAAVTRRGHSCQVPPSAPHPACVTRAPDASQPCQRSTRTHALTRSESRVSYGAPV